MNSPVLIAKHIEGNGMLQAKVLEGLVWFENLHLGILNNTGPVACWAPVVLDVFKISMEWWPSKLLTAAYVMAQLNCALYI